MEMRRFRLSVLGRLWGLGLVAQAIQVEPD